jgi:adenylate kinase
MTNVALFGPPGAGKGTQSQKLIQKYRLAHIAPGDLLREHINKKTALGQQVAKYINKGKLAPNALVIDIVAAQLAAQKDDDGFLFDGFPRTVIQARALEEKLASYNMEIDAVVFLEVPEQELIKRIKYRAKIGGRVDDQDEDKIATRMRIYHDATLPVGSILCPTKQTLQGQWGRRGRCHFRAYRSCDGAVVGHSSSKVENLCLLRISLIM